jgi:O-antigen/teichoic acid export membrane protein
MTQEGIARTRNIKKQAVYSFFIKGAAFLLSFITVPITLSYLDLEKYGVWVTISSVVAWIAFFDMGLGHGMKNKIAESMAKHEAVLTKTYISTSYLAISVFSLLAMAVITAASFMLNWQQIFKTHALTNNELQIIVLMVTFFILVNFILSLINSIINACQKSSLIELSQMLVNLFWFISIYSISKISKGNFAVFGISEWHDDSFCESSHQYIFL